VEAAVGPIAEQVVRKAATDRRHTIETAMENRDKWFQADVSRELSRLRRAIRQCDDLWVRRFLWVTLAETVRLTSNDRTSTYKLHARPSSEIENRNLSPIAVFRNLAIENATSFTVFRRRLNEANRLKSGQYVAETDARVSGIRETLRSTGLMQHRLTC